MSQSKALSKPTFIKIKQLENLRNGYTVYAKVVSAEHTFIEAREGAKIPKVDCIIADQTASAKAFFKGDNAALIQKGNVIAIRNGVVRLNKNHISLEVDIFGRVTLEKDVTVNPTQSLDISAAEHKYPDRRANNRRGGDRPRNNNYRGDRGNREERGTRGEPRRQDDRPPRRQNRDNRDRPERREGGNTRQGGDRQNRNNRSYNREQRGERRRDEPREERRNENRDYDRREGGRQYREREDRQYREREENRGDRKPLNWTKIADILPGDDNLNLNINIITLTKVGNKYRLVVGDASGISNAFVPNRIDLREGDSIVLFGARAEVVKEHIELQLAERGRIELSKKPVAKVAEEFNLSSKAWIPIE